MKDRIATSELLLWSARCQLAHRQQGKVYNQLISLHMHGPAACCIAGQSSKYEHPQKRAIAAAQQTAST